MTNKPVCGNGPATSRRALLKGLPVASAALMLPSAAPASAPDPVVAHYYDWLNARREWRALSELPGTEKLDTPETRDAGAREDRAELGMLSNAPTSPEGIAALIALAWVYLRPHPSDHTAYAELSQSPDCGPLLAIWRACTGRDGFPET